MQTPTEPRTALVLSSGASLGALQVGMLRALMEAGVRWDFIVGSSVGALNGAFIASYADPWEGLKQLEGAWSTITRKNAFPISPIVLLKELFGRSNHLFSNRGLRDWISRFLLYDDIKDFPQPFHVAAIDLLSGEELLFSDGHALTLLLATSAIPGVFPPVKYRGHTLIDGGIGQYTPIKSAADLGAERMVVVSTGFSCALDEAPRSAIGMILQSFNLLMADQLATEIEYLSDKHDLITVPPICPLDAQADDFDKSKELMQRGLAHTRSWIEDGGMDRREVPKTLRAHTHGDEGCGG